MSPEVQARVTKGNRFYALGEYDGARVQYLEALRLDPKSPEAHYGLGITYVAMGDLSSAIAAFLAKGLSVTEAVERAKAYITEAIEASCRLSVGSGHGPVHHFVRLWK